MMKRIFTLIGLCAFVSVTQAEITAYDGFNYDVDATLTGLDGGIGWATAWTSNSGSGKIVAGLDYNDANGNQLKRQGNAYEVTPAISFYQTLRDTNAVFGAGNTSVWVSFIIQQANTSSGTNYGTMTLGTGYGGGSNAMLAGIGGNPANPFVGDFYSVTNVADTTIIVGLNESVFLVLRFDFAPSGNDTLNLWFNPILGNTIGNPTLSYSSKNYAEMISGITLAHGNNRNFVYDELRIGTDYASVTPIRGDAVFNNGFE